MVALTLPKRPTGTATRSTISARRLLAAGTGSLLLGLVWGGRTYPWASAEVLGALAGSVAILGAFALVERHVEETILPFSTLRQPIVAAGAACTGMAAMCTFGTVAFVPLFVQGVIGTSRDPFGPRPAAAPARHGREQHLSRASGSHGRGATAPNALLGPIVLGTGMALLWRMDASTTSAQAARNMVIAGIGTGMMMQVFLVAAQNAVPLRVIGTTTSSLQFARGIGTTFGVTIFGVIVNQGLPAEARGGTTELHRLSGPARSQLASALHPAFLLATCVCVLMLVIVFFGIDARPLRRSLDEPGLEGAGEAVGGVSVPATALEGETGA